jgi:hypothetical protein
MSTQEGEGEIISKKDEDYEEVLLGKRSEKCLGLHF